MSPLAVPFILLLVAMTANSSRNLLLEEEDPPWLTQGSIPWQVYSVLFHSVRVVTVETVGRGVESMTQQLLSRLLVHAVVTVHNMGDGEKSTGITTSVGTTVQSWEDGEQSARITGFDGDTVQHPSDLEQYTKIQRTEMPTMQHLDYSEQSKRLTISRWGTVNHPDDREHSTGIKHSVGTTVRRPGDREQSTRITPTDGTTVQHANNREKSTKFTFTDETTVQHASSEDQSTRITHPEKTTAQYPSNREQSTNTTRPDGTTVQLPSNEEQSTIITNSYGTTVQHPSNGEHYTRITHSDGATVHYPSNDGKQSRKITHSNGTTVQHAKNREKSTKFTFTDGTTVQHSSSEDQSTRITHPDKTTVQYPSNREQSTNITRPDGTTVQLPSNEEQSTIIAHSYGTNVQHPSNGEHYTRITHSDGATVHYPSNGEQSKRITYFDGTTAEHSNNRDESKRIKQLDGAILQHTCSGEQYTRITYSDGTTVQQLGDSDQSRSIMDSNVFTLQHPGDGKQLTSFIDFDGSSMVIPYFSKKNSLSIHGMTACLEGHLLITHNASLVLTFVHANSTNWNSEACHVILITEKISAVNVYYDIFKVIWEKYKIFRAIIVVRSPNQQIVNDLIMMFDPFTVAKRIPTGQILRMTIYDLQNNMYGKLPDLRRYPLKIKMFSSPVDYLLGNVSIPKTSERLLSVIANRLNFTPNISKVLKTKPYTTHDNSSMLEMAAAVVHGSSDMALSLEVLEFHGGGGFRYVTPVYAFEQMCIQVPIAQQLPMLLGMLLCFSVELWICLLLTYTLCAVSWHILVVLRNTIRFRESQNYSDKKCNHLERVSCGVINSVIEPDPHNLSQSQYIGVRNSPHILSCSGTASSRATDVHPKATPKRLLSLNNPMISHETMLVETGTHDSITSSRIDLHSPSDAMTLQNDLCSIEHGNMTNLSEQTLEASVRTRALLSLVHSFVVVLVLFTSSASSLAPYIRHVSNRWIVAGCLFLSLVMTTLYQSAMVVQLTNPRREEQIDTFEQLDNSGLSILHINPRLQGIFNSDWESPVLDRLLRKTSYTPTKEILQRLVEKRDIAFIIPEYMTKFLLIFVPDLHLKTHVMSECPRIMYKSYILPTGSPYLPYVNDVVGRLFDAGILTLWNQIERRIAEVFFKHLGKKVSKDEDMGPKPIKLSEIYIAFYILGLGLSASFVVFLTEIFSTRWKSKKTLII